MSSSTSFSVPSTMIFSDGVKKRKPTQSDDDLRQEFAAELDQTTGYLKTYLEANVEKEKENPLFLALSSCLRLLSYTRESFLPKECPIEREKRERSIVVENLPESTAKRASQRVEEDWKNVVAMLDAADVEVRPAAIFRMGQRKDALPGQSSPRPRLLKVVLPCSSAQKTLLRKSRDVCSVPEFKSIRIRPSLSAADREIQYGLRQEKKRLNAGGGSWVIYAGILMEKSKVNEYKQSHPRSRLNTPITKSSFNFPN